MAISSYCGEFGKTAADVWMSCVVAQEKTRDSPDSLDDEGTLAVVRRSSSSCMQRCQLCTFP